MNYLKYCYFENVLKTCIQAKILNNVCSVGPQAKQHFSKGFRSFLNIAHIVLHSTWFNFN